MNVFETNQSNNSVDRGDVIEMSKTAIELCGIRQLQCLNFFQMCPWSDYGGIIADHASVFQLHNASLFCKSDNSALTGKIITPGGELAKILANIIAFEM